MSAVWIFAFMICERLLELCLSTRNIKALAANNAREYYPETFPRMVALHTFFLAALIIESFPWQIPLDTLTWIVLALLGMLQLLRYWCIASLGRHWNTRIIIVPGGKAVSTGPYRFIRHPNYLIVTIEFLLLPLLLRAPWTFILFFPANIFILQQRIRLEEQALIQYTDYAQQFPVRKH